MKRLIRSILSLPGRINRQSPLAVALLTALIGALLIAFAASQLETYGFALFLGTPFWVGLLSALLYGYNRQRTLSSCVGYGLVTLLLLVLAILCVAVEGLLCVLMAAPIGVPICMLGSGVGWAIQAHRWRFSRPPFFFLLVLILPTCMGMEARIQPEPPLFAVRSAVEIEAPPTEVWRHVVSFPDLPPPREWLFRAGIAYPIRAKIYGHGVGAERRCVFSTGPFIEPIQVWDEPRLLRFRVTSNPAPMQELSPYPNLHPPHLHGFLVSEQGQFRLIALPGGRTRLEGTTWYRHHMEPAGYWQQWSDYIIHRIHLRVLNHIKVLCEGRA